MGALEFEVSRLVMIEAPQCPAIGVMALSAIRPQALLVYIFGFVALDAFLGRLLEGR